MVIVTIIGLNVLIYLLIMLSPKIFPSTLPVKLYEINITLMTKSTNYFFSKGLTSLNLFCQLISSLSLHFTSPISEIFFSFIATFATPPLYSLNSLFYLDLPFFPIYTQITIPYSLPWRFRFNTWLISHCTICKSFTKYCIIHYL